MIWWLLAAEIWMSLRRWHGLSIIGPRGVWLTFALLIGDSWLLIVRGEPHSWRTILLGSALGLLLFLLLAVWRQRNLSPTLVFASGERSGRRITDVAIPLEDGPMPGVLVESERGNSVGVLVVHGAGDHKTFYAWPRLHALADAGFAACAIDVDGHGDNPRVLDFPSVLDDVAAGVAWLRERYAQVAVIGISQGGCIAARAVAEGVAVDALVIMEAPITVNVTKAVIRREARIVAHPATWALHREVGTVGLVRGWRTPATRTRIGTVDLIERLDIVGSVSRITCPLLLSYGGSDAVVPVSQARTIAAAAPPDSTLLIVPRATHLSLSIDQRVIAMITRWLHTALDTNRQTG